MPPYCCCCCSSAEAEDVAASWFAVRLADGAGSSAVSLAFAALFLVSWAAQGVAPWQVYAAEQAEPGEQVQLSGFG